MEHSQLGRIVFKSSLRARKMRITVRSGGDVVVTVPKGTARSRAEDFLNSRLKWVLKARTTQNQKHEEMVRYCSSLPEIGESTARIKLREKLEQLSKELGLKYKRVFFRRQKTRWGSCSGKNNINLNINLARLPQNLQNYVLIHELVHTRIKKHDRKFWSEIEKIIPDYRLCRKELALYNPRIMETL